MARRPHQPVDACPFIDDGDPQCAAHFTLDHIGDAMDQCIGGYRSCANYWRLARRNPERLIVITAHGRPLQPTGT